MLTVFNSYHPNLQFTYEIENKNSISFLELKIIRKGEQLITDWYQKPTFSGKLLSFKSNHPLHQKIGIIYNLVDKSILLANKTFHNKNLEFTKKILSLNQYPIQFIQKYVNKRLHVLKTKNNSNNNIRDRHRRNRIYRDTPKLKIPFHQNLFNKIKHSIKKLNIIPVAEIHNKLDNVIKKRKRQYEKNG